MRYTFTSGEWIDIRPIDKLKAKDKDVYAAAIKLYVTFGDDGTPDMSNVPFDMTIPAIQRNALLARLLVGGDGWSFTGDDGAMLPVPVWNDEQNTIENEASIGEIPIDDWNELEALLAPYVEKVKIRPNPKQTITANSTDTSSRRARAGSRTA